MYVLSLVGMATGAPSHSRKRLSRRFTLCTNGTLKCKPGSVIGAPTGFPNCGNDHLLSLVNRIDRTGKENEEQNKGNGDNIKMFFSRKRAVDIGRNPLIRLVRRMLPVSDTYHGARFTVRRDGRRLLTPLALVLIMIEVTDVLFAVDSIPAIFGITRDPFIVYTSNICAILGLRSLYFLLAGVVHKFVYLKPPPWQSSSPLSAPRCSWLTFITSQRRPHLALLVWFYRPRSVCPYSQTINVQRQQSLRKLTSIHHLLLICDDN